MPESPQGLEGALSTREGHDSVQEGAVWFGERNPSSHLFGLLSGCSHTSPHPHHTGALEGPALTWSRHNLQGPSEPSRPWTGLVPCPLSKAPCPAPRYCFATDCCQDESGGQVATGVWPPLAGRASGPVPGCGGWPWREAQAGVFTSQRDHWRNYFKAP